MRYLLFLFFLPGISFGQETIPFGQRIANESGVPVTVKADGSHVVHTATVQSPEEVSQEVAGGRFGNALNRAARKAAREGKITRRDAMRLRIAMLSPAFRQQAEELAVVQMYYGANESSSKFIPLDADGKVERGKIDWDSLIAFLERLIPIILQLLEIFGK